MLRNEAIWKPDKAFGDDFNKPWNGPQLSEMQSV